MKLNLKMLAKPKVLSTDVKCANYKDCLMRVFLVEIMFTV